MSNPPNTTPAVSPARAVGLAFSFLTIVPVRFREGTVTPADLAASRWAYPAVGAVIGLALAALSGLLDRWGASASVAAFLLVAAWAAIAGGLHLDGLADTADGLFLSGGAERRLAVMRDPRVGSFGVVALVLVILGKYAALTSLGGKHRALALLGAAVVSRTLILVSAGSASSARREGTGRPLIEATTRRDAQVAALLVLVLGMAFGRNPGLAAGAAALGLAWGLNRLAARRIGGVTGDILGALVELSELLFLVIVSGR